MKELVIQMSDDMFERIMKAQSTPDMCGTDIVNAMNCIKSGTVLPKGHDRLVEAKAVIKTLFAHQTIDDVPTIVEADKEKEK
jgi:hypothetical protein